jgi:hypothetical protein
VGEAHQVGYLQELIERSPAAFLAALEALAILALAGIVVRLLFRQEKLQRAHGRQVAELQKEHTARVDSIRLAELERAVKLEHLVQGVLRMVEVGTIEVVRGRRRKKPATNPGLSMEPDAPTLTFPPGMGEAIDDDE